MGGWLCKQGLGSVGAVKWEVLRVEGFGGLLVSFCAALLVGCVSDGVGGVDGSGVVWFKLCRWNDVHE